MTVPLQFELYNARGKRERSVWASLPGLRTVLSILEHSVPIRSILYQLTGKLRMTRATLHTTAENFDNAIFEASKLRAFLALSRSHMHTRSCTHIIVFFYRG